VSVMLPCGADACAAVPGEELHADCSSGCRVVPLSHFLVPRIFQRTARRYIPENRIFHNYRCENFRVYEINHDNRDNS
jgi:hypothetical protein